MVDRVQSNNPVFFFPCDFISTSAVAPGTPVLTVDQSGSFNADNDNVPTDEDAILIEGLEYHFDCSVAADPEADIVWNLRDAAGNVIDTETDDAGAVDDCTAISFTGQYTLQDNLVTFAGLQCGYLECSASNIVSSAATVRIYFQIWSKCNVRHICSTQPKW